MYKQSPMENFNKNNPQIIVAKKKYDNILDDLQLFSKICVQWCIIISILWLMITGLCIKCIYDKSEYAYLISISILICASIIFSIYAFRMRIKYFMALHPDMIEFDRISEMEVNDIIALNIEAVMKCTNGLYKLHGELIATIKYYKFTFKIFTLIEIIMSVLLIIQIFM